MKHNGYRKRAKGMTRAILAFSFFSLSLVSCEEGEATYLKLDKNEITLYVGEEEQLSALTDKKNAFIRWSSDALDVASVEDGVVMALSEGDATITARCGKRSASCDVTVKEKEADDDKKKDDDNPPIEIPEEICNAYKDYFKIGAAIQTGKLTSNGYGDLMKHFNSITAENNMKWKNLEKTEGSYSSNQSSSDNSQKMMAWAKENNVSVRGHCLLWYKSLPSWLHDIFDGKEYSESVKTLAYSYIDKHIEETMKDFGDNIYVWDVVNEALFNSVDSKKLVKDASHPYGNVFRTNDNMSSSTNDWVDWHKVCGGDTNNGYLYIAEAFKKADEVRKKYNYTTDLYYNDYSLNNPNKRQACLNLIQMLKDNNAPIDGIGMQSHYKLRDYLSDKEGFLDNFETSIQSFLNADVDVQITELDIKIMDEDGNKIEGWEEKQAEMFGEIFKICRKYAKTEGKKHGITSVTTWGVQDGSNGAQGTDELPLIFGKDLKPKKAYDKIMGL